MNHTVTSLKSLLIATFAAAAGLGLTACSTYNEYKIKAPQASASAQQPQVETPKETTLTQEEKDQAFSRALSNVGMKTKEDPQYQRMDLSSQADKEWFTSVTRRLWDGEIDRAQFITEGLERYPTHIYELEFIADGLLAQKNL